MLVHLATYSMGLLLVCAYIPSLVALLEVISSMFPLVLSVDQNLLHFLVAFLRSLVRFDAPVTHYFARYIYDKPTDD